MKNIKTYTDALNETGEQVALNGKLLSAAFNGYTDDVAYWIDKGAQVDVRNYDNNMPLHYAASKGHTETARLLIDMGADVDARGGDGRTPLHYAASKGHVDTTRLLIQRGADLFKAFKDPVKIIEFFNGDVDWWPEGELKVKLKRMAKGKSAFGM